jgi:hypothetical protein
MEIISRPGNRGRNNMYVTEKSEYGFKKKIYMTEGFESRSRGDQGWESEVGIGSAENEESSKAHNRQTTGEERAWMLTELGMRTCANYTFFLKVAFKWGRMRVVFFAPVVFYSLNVCSLHHNIAFYTKKMCIMHLKNFSCARRAEEGHE